MENAPANVCRISGLSYEILIKSNKRISCREYCSKSRVPISLQRIYATDLIRPDNEVSEGFLRVDMPYPLEFNNGEGGEEGRSSFFYRDSINHIS